MCYISVVCKHWLHSHSHLLLFRVLLLCAVAVELFATSASAAATATQPSIAEPVLPIGRCTVHQPVTFTFECQLAAFGGYLPQQHHGEQVDVELAKRVQIAQDAAMLACSSSDRIHRPLSSTVPSPSDKQATAVVGFQGSATTDASIVLVRRGECSFQHKLLELVTNTTGDSVYAMVVINSDDSLLSMGTLTHEGDDMLRGAVAVAVKRSDGERLLQLVRDQMQQSATAPASAAVLLSITSAAPRARQVLQRIEYQLHANAPLLAVETFMDALPAPLRDVDALLCMLTHALSTSQVRRSPCSRSVDWHEADSEREQWIAFFHACARAFPLKWEFARGAALHAAAAAAWLVWTAPPQASVSASALEVELDSLWQLAAHQLADAGYYDASAFCLEQELTRRRERGDGDDVNYDDPDGVSVPQCQLALVTFLQGEIAASVAMTKRCLDHGIGVNGSAPSTRVAHETLMRLAVLDLSSADLQCLRQSTFSLETNSGDDGSDDSDEPRAPCCVRRALPSRDDDDDSVASQRRRRQQFVFRSHAVGELFHALNVMGVFLDELGAFRESLRFFAQASRLCPDDLSLELHRALAVPVVFDSSADITAFYAQLEANIAALTARPRAERKSERELASITGSAYADAIAELRPEDATYLQYTITPSTMFVGYQGVDVLPMQRAIFDLRTRLFPSLRDSETSPRGLEVPQPQQPPLGPSVSAPRHRRRRVAFISTWFRNHSVGKLLLGVVQRLDRTKFRVLIYRCAHFLRERDEVTAAFERAGDTFVDLPANQDAALALLRGAAIDVAVFPELGMDAWTVLLAHHRVAPVQCVFWGHPITTANPAIDYFVSSEYFVSDFFDTPQDGDAHGNSGDSDGDSDDTLFKYHGSSFSEQVVLFRGLSTFFTRPEVPRLDARVTRSMLQLPENRRLYVCPQTLMKLHPAFDRVLAAILRQDPRACVVLLASETQRVWTEQLQRRFRRAFGASGARRVLFMPTLPFAEFMALLAFADVVLDPFPFGGGVTTLDALALGIPVVTLPAAQTVPQLAAGFLRSMNVTATIVRSVDEFVAVALAVAADAGGVRAQLQRELLQRHDALYEDAASVDDWNSFLERVATV